MESLLLNAILPVECLNEWIPCSSNRQNHLIKPWLEGMLKTITGSKVRITSILTIWRWIYNLNMFDKEVHPVFNTKQKNLKKLTKLE